MVYLLYFLGCILFSFHLCVLFPLVIDTTHLLAIYGIVATVIGVILGVYSRKKENREGSN